MTDDIYDELTPQQGAVLSTIRNITVTADYDALTRRLDITRSTARDHVAALKRHPDVHIVERRENGRKVFEYEESETAETAADGPAEPTRYTKTTEKAKTTEALNEKAQQMERRLTDILSQSEPAVADDGLSRETNNEDVVLHATDDHVGDLTEDEFENTTYDPETWRSRRKETMNTAFDLVDRQTAAGHDFDTMHLLLGGDMVTGEGIYPGQAHDLAWPLDKQVEEAAKLYMTQIRRASSRFKSVQVVCQSGNHGELRFSGASGGSNADRLLFLMLDAMVRQSDLENVTFIRNSSTNFTNFEMRTHKGHLRHGDDSLEHIGTSAGKRRWFNWRDKHQFDVAYRGHYHQFQRDTLTRTYQAFVNDEEGNIVTDEHGEPVTRTETVNVPVIMTGSLKPPEEFEESIAAWSQPSATIHGVSDDRPVTWLFAVDFN